MATQTLTADETRRALELFRAGKLGSPQELVDQYVAPDEREFADTSTAAALGGKYRLADLPLAHYMGHFGLLYLISSPLVRESVSEVSMTDLAIAVYVLAVGEDAVQPQMDYQCLMASVIEAREMAKASPELLAVWIDKNAQAKAIRQEFEAAAMDHWREHVPADTGIQEVMDWLLRMINDAMEAAAMMGGDAQKKTAAGASHSMPNGWRKWRPQWLASCLARLGIKCSGRYRSRTFSGYSMPTDPRTGRRFLAAPGNARRR